VQGIWIVGVVLMQENQIPFTEARIVCNTREPEDAVLQLLGMQTFNSPPPRPAPEVDGTTAVLMRDAACPLHAERTFGAFAEILNETRSYHDMNPIVTWIL